MITVTEQQAGDLIAEQTVVPEWMRAAVEQAGGEHGRVEVTRRVTPFGTYVTGVVPVCRRDVVNRPGQLPGQPYWWAD